MRASRPFLLVGSALLAAAAFAEDVPLPEPVPEARADLAVTWDPEPRVRGAHLFARLEVRNVGGAWSNATQGLVVASYDSVAGADDPRLRELSVRRLRPQRAQRISFRARVRPEWTGRVLIARVSDPGVPLEEPNDVAVSQPVPDARE